MNEKVGMNVVLALMNVGLMSRLLY